MTDISQLESDLAARVDAAADVAALEAVRVAALGKSGQVSELLKSLGAMSPDQRRAQGPLINGLRDRLTARIAQRRAALDAAALDAELAAGRLDLSLPASTRRRGAVHPTMQVMDEMIAIFAEMGFAMAEGPDIEDDFHNFTALNFPPKHPAREMHDTFFLQADANGDRKVLRTHTSPVQVRTLLSRELPVHVVAPGRVYRADALDATHSPVFAQLEGLCVDEGITMAHLRGTLDAFAVAMFGPGMRTRLRPSFFPFTEPSAELDLQCFHCLGRSAEPGGEPCRVCSSEGWIEVGGCGMVNPAVLVAAGVDPERYSGFAFGMGLDRTLMFRHGATDIRDFYEGDQRFTLPFGLEA